MDKQADMDDG